MAQKHLISLLIVCSTAGCYTFRPLPADQIAIGSRVRASLSEDGAEKLRDALGDAGVSEQVEAELLGRDPSELQLSVGRRVRAEGYTERLLTQRVAVARDDVIVLEVKELDRTRTAVLGATALAAGFGIVIKAFSGGPNTPRGGGPPPTSETVIPLQLRITLP